MREVIGDVCLSCGKDHNFELWGAKCKCRSPNVVHKAKCDGCDNVMGQITDDDYHGPEKLYCHQCVGNAGFENSPFYDIDWKDISDPPECQSRVLIMGVDKRHDFGCPELLLGWYVDKYYDTPINEFRIDGSPQGYTLVKWAYAPREPEIDRSNKCYE